MKQLQYWQRDFNTCGDCIYCSGLQPIDQRYPQAKQGFCSYHQKYVKNFPEVNCQQFSSKLECYGDDFISNYYDQYQQE